MNCLMLSLVFINGWYTDILLHDYFFLFPLLIELLLFVGYICCLIFSIKRVLKERTILNIISIIILIIAVLLVVFFPFRKCKAKVELSLYEDERLEVIELLKSNKLKTDELGNLDLPEKYRKISTGGEVTVYQNDEDEQVINFWIFRGMLSGSTQLIYSTGGEKLIKDNEGGHPITYIEKLHDNWYYVETDY